MRRVIAAVAAVAAAATAVVVALIPPAAAAVADARVTVVGDSVAAGWTLSSAQVAWPSRAADRMWGQDHTRLTVDAVGGRCLVAAGCAGVPITQTWATTVISVSPRPTTVILAAGENDVSRLPAAAVESAITQLVTQASAAGIRVLVATIPPQEASRWPTWWGWGPTMLQVNTWIRATYGSNVIDFYGAIVDPSTGWMRAAVESGDGVHPNRYGHVDLADAVPIGRVV